MKKIFFISEIGINHNGDIDTTKKLIDVSVESGCDAVKFQKRTIDVVYDEDMLDSSRESPWGTTQREQKEGLEFDVDEYNQIDEYCKEKNIEWFASSWDVKSQDFLKQYNLKYNKLASPMITNIPLVKRISDEKKHTFISTGMSTYEDIDRVVDIFKERECPFTLLHCVSTYPTHDSDCNIEMINSLRKRYDCEVGYSGHEKGILPSLLSVLNGASVIERHITLDKNMYGSDQKSSLLGDELKQLITYVNNIESIMGDGVKRILEGEIQILDKLRYW